MQGSLRKHSEQSSGQDKPRRPSAGNGTQSQPVSRSASPAAKSLYQTNREKSCADMQKASSQTKATKVIQQNNAAKLDKSKANLQLKVSGS